LGASSRSVYGGEGVTNRVVEGPCATLGVATLELSRIDDDLARVIVVFTLPLADPASFGLGLDCAPEPACAVRVVPSDPLTNLPT